VLKLMYALQHADCRLAQVVAYVLTKKLEEFVMICVKTLGVSKH